MLTFKHTDYIKYAMADRIPRVLIDAVHAAPKRHDIYTGVIAEKVAELTGCHCIIATVSRNIADLNRPPSPEYGNEKAIREYRGVIHQMLQENGLLDEKGAAARPFLHLAIHGKKDREDGRDIELGSCYGGSCSPALKDWIVDQFERNAGGIFWRKQRPGVVLDQSFSGDSSKQTHRNNYGGQFNTIQVEYSIWIREKYREAAILDLCKVIEQFIEQFS